MKTWTNLFSDKKFAEKKKAVRNYFKVGGNLSSTFQDLEFDGSL